MGGEGSCGANSEGWVRRDARARGEGTRAPGADQVDAFFGARLGPFDQAYDVMCKMSIDELEDLLKAKWDSTKGRVVPFIDAAKVTS